jgi:hypothetical protein
MTSCQDAGPGNEPEMSNGYDRVAFTRHVRDAQARYGSRALAGAHITG